MCIGFTMQVIQYAKLVTLQRGSRSEYPDLFFFCGFSQYLQSYSGIVGCFKLGYCFFVPNPFQFIIHVLSFCHWTLYSLSTVVIIKRQIHKSINRISSEFLLTRQGIFGFRRSFFMQLRLMFSNAGFENKHSLL